MFFVSIAVPELLEGVKIPQNTKYYTTSERKGATY